MLTKVLPLCTQIPEIFALSKFSQSGEKGIQTKLLIHGIVNLMNN